MNDVKFIEQKDSNNCDQACVDSRPPRASRNAMLQHFLGQEIEVERPVFDDSTAILMDFRVDQTHDTSSISFHFPLHAGGINSVQHKDSGR